ncbi:MAG TPA: hypothetical protein VLJ59_10845 [Mycobacteriales bacterium]|nr:hypothetical protein [Mycobacteriales bacterium]
MSKIEPARSTAVPLGAAQDLVDARGCGVFAFDTHDAMAAGDAVRVLVCTKRPGRAAHLMRRAGFRVRSWTPPLTLLPRVEAEMACSAPDVVMWRSHDPALAEQWFWLPR